MLQVFVDAEINKTCCPLNELSDCILQHRGHMQGTATQTTLSASCLLFWTVFQNKNIQIKMGKYTDLYLKPFMSAFCSFLPSEFQCYSTQDFLFSIYYFKNPKTHKRTQPKSKSAHTFKNGFL